MRVAPFSSIPLAALLLGWIAAAPARAAAPADAPVPTFTLPSPRAAELLAEDAQRAAAGLPYRFAVANPVIIRPATDGIWQDLSANERVWRLHIECPGALSLNLGFTAFHLPDQAELRILTPAGQTAGPYTARDNQPHGQLWTPVLPGDDLTLQLRAPRDQQNHCILELSAINAGYRPFGLPAAARDAGACNIDVICPQSAGWEAQIRSVAVYSVDGLMMCTGVAINNTAQDRRPYFLTAYHCGVDITNAASVVVYWNYESPVCGQHGGGSLAQFQSGAIWRAAHDATDFTLLELSTPPQPDFNVVYAGWDRSSTAPTSAVCIHHPSTFEKSISFDNDPCPITGYLANTSGDQTHLRTAWDLGVTEPGSSGSPLFNAEKRVVGQLHGGYSACGSGDMRDWYGRFARSWTGGNTSTSRLSDWLDPLATGATVMDHLYDTPPSGLLVRPNTGLEFAGPLGGPFAPDTITYTVKNVGNEETEFAVRGTIPWITITGGAGLLAPGATALVTVRINSAAAALPNGFYTDTVTFANLTDNVGTTARVVQLRVGSPGRITRWDLDANPNWSTTGLWSWGVPTGAASPSGHPDPAAGYTGTHVLGYNLNGGYANNLATEHHLTTTAIDCTHLENVQLRFWRWLGIEASAFDHARIRVSTNGVNWNEVWSNPNTLIDDGAWTQQELDLSTLADHQPAFFIRWSLGPTDDSYAYCGWNLDDIEIWAAPDCVGAFIITQPTSQSRKVGESATFAVVANGDPTPTYQWRRGSVDLKDSPNVFGSHTATLTISPVTPTDAGAYECVITNACGTALTNPVQLTVFPPLCRGDANCDGVIDWRDIDYLVAGQQDNEPVWRALFGTNPPTCEFANCDVNADAHVDWRDIDPFVERLNTTCP